MKTLYLHNYKGFANTFIPFLDVNFFVGENSTGKTAILNLINILSDLKFWFMPDFNNDNVELGYFNEIVNQRAGKKASFEIGIEFSDKKSNDEISKFIWLKFREKDNRPIIKEYRFLSNNKTVQVDICSKWAEYRVCEYANEPFEEWIRKGSTQLGHKRRIQYPRPNLPFGVIRSVVSSAISDNPHDVSVGGFILSQLFNRLIWLSPIRAKAKRSYESYKSAFSPEGAHTPIILKNIFSNKQTERNSSIISALNHFGKESGLFDEIEINDFGKEKGSPFSINVSYDSMSIRITNVGYGVSQILPILVEILTSNEDTFAIQQPEVHLHPKAQAAFGELLYFATTESKNRFFIETHSDFTINRFRLNVFKSNKKSRGQVLFFERTSNGTKVTPLKFNDKGQYPDSIPASYTQFFVDEELKMLEF